MKLFIIFDTAGKVATTEINPLESTTKASDVSLHILYSAKAIYSVHAESWLKKQEGQNTDILTMLALLGYTNTTSDFSTLPKAEPVMSGDKIVGLQNDVFYVGPERVAVKAKKTVKPNTSPVAPAASAGEANPAFA